LEIDGCREAIGPSHDQEPGEGVRLVGAEVAEIVPACLIALQRRVRCAVYLVTDEFPKFVGADDFLSQDRPIPMAILVSRYGLRQFATFCVNLPEPPHSVISWSLNIFFCDISAHIPEGMIGTDSLRALFLRDRKVGSSAGYLPQYVVNHEINICIDANK
jgi:hypothetical protein